tara:strand:+ start:226 stop:858 length:633 start_codon:yes stop_codon:yes gene_type:complete
MKSKVSLINTIEQSNSTRRMKEVRMSNEILLNPKFNTATFQCFTQEQVKEINKLIKKNIVGKESSTEPAEYVTKIGDFSVVPCMPLMKLIHPWLAECQKRNRDIFGYDIYWDFHLEGLNYNVYGTGGEYEWHIDVNNMIQPLDAKLTCLLNLSEEPYEGGEFCIVGGVTPIEFTSGMGLVMTSLIGHKVTPITKGERITLSYWAVGPSWK